MPREDFRPDLPAYARQAPLLGFLSAWDTWRGDALVPTRAQIRLSETPDLMRATMLLDVYAPERMVFRYAGSLYQEMYGFDFAGLNYLEITDPAVRPLRAKRLWGVVSQPAAAVWTVPGEDGVDFAGASVPVRPDEPGQSMKILQILVPLKDLGLVSDEAWREQRGVVRFSDHFKYIDIGAGKPDCSVEA